MKTVFTAISIFLSGTAIAQALPADTLQQERFSLHAQTTVVYQNKPAFSAPYSGANSLSPGAEAQTSITATLFAGARLWKGAGIFLNPEIAGGSGLSQALGIANATNGETFRVGSADPKLYLARLYYRQTFDLKPGSHESAGTDFNQLAGKEPTHYAAITLGKVSLADFFDDNRYSHNPRTQFLSWSLMDNGAWDYAANTRGYTVGGVAEWVTPKHELRYALALLPTTANGGTLNSNLGQANAHVLEYTHRHSLAGKPGAVRLLGFFNKANMGSYRNVLADEPTQPKIEDFRIFSCTKWGFGISAEQELTDDLGAFFRASWNDGRNETWVFTEIDHSISGGLCMTGKRWHRPEDNIGFAYVVSGISAAHRDYLAAGGRGFMLGDGALNYGLEHLGELYYSAAVSPGHIWITGGYQLLHNPGYNRDRPGPVSVFSVRVHARI